MSVVKDRSVADGVGELGNKTIKVLGHWVYVRKCVHADPLPIVLPETMRDTADRMARWVQVEVLAMGDKVGVRRKESKRLLGRRGWVRQQVADFHIGDIVFVPNRSDFIKASPVNPEDEFFIDENEIKAVLEL